MGLASVGAGSIAARTVVVGVVLVVGLVLVAIAPGPAARAATRTQVTLTVTIASGIDVDTYTGVQMHAVVQPSTVAGRVTFSIDGAELGTATVIGGAADLSSTVHVADGVPARAVFEPAASSGYAVSSSPEVAVSVRAVPRVWLVDDSGRTLPARGVVTVGGRYRAMLSGFAYRSDVRVSLGAATLAVARIGSGGTAAAVVVIPVLRSGPARLAARAPGRTAGMVLQVVVAAEPSPSPTPPGGNVSVVVPGPSLPSTGDDGVDDAVDEPAVPLAHTGAQPLPVLLLAAALLVTGLALVAGARRRSAPGRHAPGRRARPA